MRRIEVESDGFVRLVDNMGTDNSVVRAARVSYGKETKGEKADKKLIKYLLKNQHETPFEMLTFTFHIRCPMFVARQWFRHRIGSFSEISRRYTTVNATDFWAPNIWRTNDQQNKQSSSAHLELSKKESAELMRHYHETLDEIERTYNHLIKNGVAREQARAILPMASYTEFYWTVNARSLFNFIRLRTAPEAQLEIQNYGAAVLSLVQPIAPWTFEAFEELQLNSCSAEGGNNDE